MAMKRIRRYFPLLLTVFAIGTVPISAMAGSIQVLPVTQEPDTPLVEAPVESLPDLVPEGTTHLTPEGEGNSMTGNKADVNWKGFIHSYQNLTIQVTVAVRDSSGKLAPDAGSGIPEAIIHSSCLPGGKNGVGENGALTIKGLHSDKGYDFLVTADGYEDSGAIEGIQPIKCPGNTLVISLVRIVQEEATPPEPEPQPIPPETGSQPEPPEPEVNPGPSTGGEGSGPHEPGGDTGHGPGMEETASRQEESPAIPGSTGTEPESRPEVETGSGRHNAATGSSAHSGRSAPREHQEMDAGQATEASKPESGETVSTMVVGREAALEMLWSLLIVLILLLLAWMGKLLFWLLIGPLGGLYLFNEEKERLCEASFTASNLKKVKWRKLCKGWILSFDKKSGESTVTVFSEGYKSEIVELSLRWQWLVRKKVIMIRQENLPKDSEGNEVENIGRDDTDNTGSAGTREEKEG